MTVHFLLTAALLYVLIALFYHGFKSNSLVGFKDTNTTRILRSNALVNSLILLPAASTVLYVAAILPELSTIYYPFCVVQSYFETSVYTIALVSVYVALWYRVYTVFYSVPSLNESVPKSMKTANIASLVFLILFAIFGAGLYYSDTPHKASRLGCTVVNNILSVKLVVLAFCSALAQMFLLFSLAYPLYMLRKNMLNRGFNTKPILPIIKRVAVVGGVCVLSDLLTVSFSAIYSPTVHLHYVDHTVCGVNVAVNIISGVMSTVDWKVKLQPFRGLQSNAEGTSKPQSSNGRVVSTQIASKA